MHAPSPHALAGIWLLIPFILQLLAIALLPFLAHHWWERHYPKVSAVLGATVAGYYLFALHDAHRVAESLHEYGSFLILNAALLAWRAGPPP
jgi:hypothetical protein